MPHRRFVRQVPSPRSLQMHDGAVVETNKGKGCVIHVKHRYLDGLFEIAKDLGADRQWTRRTHQKPDGVERMNTDVDERAAARSLFVGEPPTAPVGNPTRPNKSGG